MQPINRIDYYIGSLENFIYKGEIMVDHSKEIIIPAKGKEKSIVFKGAISHIPVRKNTSSPLVLTNTHEGKFITNKPTPINPASECTIHENQLIP